MTTYKKRYIFFALLVCLMTVCSFWSVRSVEYSDDKCQRLVTSDSVKKGLTSTSQIILVTSMGGSKAEITACQKTGMAWIHVLTPSFPGVIGKKGLAPLGTKKEGDLKTPAGLYPIGEAFGSNPLVLKMDYKYITVDDKFIDDVTSPHYNTWVRGKTDAKSYEPMLIDQYKMGLVINYNMNPTVTGAGSAIFMHLWGSLNTPTVGCVATDEQHLSALLYWLDKKQHPYIYITN